MIKAIIAVILALVLLIAAIVASPMGILFTEDATTAGGTSTTRDFRNAMQTLDENLSQAVSEALEQVYAGTSISTQPVNWQEVMAVYAGVLGCTPEDTSSATNMRDAERQQLEEVFWEFYQISQTCNATSVATPAGSSGSAVTTKTLTVNLTLSAVSWKDVGERYRLDRENLGALLGLDEREWQLEAIQTAQGELEADYAAKLEDTLAQAYSALTTGSHVTQWKQVLSVYAVRVGADETDPQEVYTMDDAKFAVLEETFWDMNQIDCSAQVTQNDVVDGNGGVVTTYTIVVTLSVTQRSAEEMAQEYNFTEEGIMYLTELLTVDDSLWDALLTP